MLNFAVRYRVVEKKECLHTILKPPSIMRWLLLEHLAADNARPVTIPMLVTDAVYAETKLGQVLEVTARMVQPDT